MELVYKGKTKDVYLLEDGNYLMKFKDDATGKDGVFDPGENSVGLSIAGLGKKSLSMSAYYFDKLEKLGIPTHFISYSAEDATMTVRQGKHFGKGVEVICRFRAVGSFYRRYSDYIEQGAELDAFVEFTLKNDEKQDPPINKEGLIMLGIMTEAEYETCVTLTKKIAGIIKDDVAIYGYELYDIKFEFGKSGGGVILMDEISAGNMRLYKDGEWIQPMDIILH